LKSIARIEIKNDLVSSTICFIKLSHYKKEKSPSSSAS
jgi:hypothetical protein